MKSTITNSQKKKYEKIIEEATVDCNDEEEQIVGWECLFDENIATPCNCFIGKQQAILEKVCSDDHGGSIIAVVKLNKTKMRVLIQDIVVEDKKAMEHINAYKYWCKN